MITINPIPSGTITVSQFANMIGLDGDSAQIILDQLVSSNTITQPNNHLLFNGPASDVFIDVYLESELAGQVINNSEPLNDISKWIGIHAEEGQVLNDNNDEWSFGNGLVSSLGYVSLVDGTIGVAGLSVVDAPTTGDTEVAVTINGTIAGSVTLPVGTNSGVNDFPPVAVVKGDVINFRTITANGAGKAVVNTFIKTT